MTANDDYWKKREKQERAWIDSNIKNDKDFDKLVEKRYNALTEDIMNQINKEYINLGKRDGWTMADAQQKVKAMDVEKFGETAKDLVEQARELYKKNGKVSYYDFTDRTNKAMRLYNATMRINRLEMLKAQIGTSIVSNNIKVNSDLNKKLTDDAIKEYKRQAGILGKNRSVPDLKQIVKIVSAQTGDVSFSERIWHDNTTLKAELDYFLTKQLIRGISPNEIARELRREVNKRVDSAKYATERIARTESARVQNKVQLESFAKYRYNFCKWINEPTACTICVDIGGNDEGWGNGVYKTSNVPNIPAHPNCRCSIAAYEPDEAKLESHGLTSTNTKYGGFDFDNLDKNDSLINEITVEHLMKAIDGLGDMDSSNNIDAYNNVRLNYMYNLASQISYDSKPTLIDSETFDDKVDKKSIINRVTDRYNQLESGNLEYSSYGKSLFGHAIYFGIEDMSVYSRGERYKNVIATLNDDAKIVDVIKLRSKFNSLKKELPDEYKQKSEKLRSKHTEESNLFDIIAMYLGIDGSFDSNNKYLMLLNRGKLVIRK